MYNIRGAYRRSICHFTSISSTLHFLVHLPANRGVCLDLSQEYVSPQSGSLTTGLFNLHWHTVTSVHPFPVSYLVYHSANKRIPASQTQPPATIPYSPLQPCLAQPTYLMISCYTTSPPSLPRYPLSCQVHMYVITHTILHQTLLATVAQWLGHRLPMPGCRLSRRSDSNLVQGGSRGFDSLQLHIIFLLGHWGKDGGEWCRMRRCCRWLNSDWQTVYLHSLHIRHVRNYIDTD